MTWGEMGRNGETRGEMGMGSVVTPLANRSLWLVLPPVDRCLFNLLTSVYFSPGSLLSFSVQYL